MEASVRKSDAAFAAAKVYKILQQYCSHNAVEANVKVSDAALANLYKTFVNVYRKSLLLYWCHNAVTANVQVSDAALANVHKVFAIIL